MSLKDKIKAHTAAKTVKTSGPVAGARAHKESISGGLDKSRVRIPKAIKSLLEVLTADDVDAVARVYREAMGATHRYWSDEGKDPKTGRAKGKWVIEADHKTRLNAANMVAAYKEGLPIQRQIQLNANFADLGADLSQLRSTPEGARALKALTAGGSLPVIEAELQESENTEGAAGGPERATEN